MERPDRFEITRHIALFRDVYRCVECGGAEQLHVDHIVPIASLGVTREERSPAHRVENLQTLCHACHVTKGNRGERWYAELAEAREADLREYLSAAGCSACGAPAGEECVSVSGRSMRTAVHAPRKALLPPRLPRFSGASYSRLNEHRRAEAWVSLHALLEAKVEPE